VEDNGNNHGTWFEVRATQARAEETRRDEMSIEAMKQAFEALDAYSWEQVNAARAALRAAIEQAEKRKPVAWMLDDGNGDYTYFDKRWGVIPSEAVPLYDR